MTKLKKCPFCGGEDIITDIYDYGSTDWVITANQFQCNNCEAIWGDKAIAAWNRRAEHIVDANKKVEPTFTKSDLFCLKALLDNLRKRTKPNGILHFTVVDLLTKCEAALKGGEK